MSLRQFRDEYLDLLLRFLWREWTSLGVAGQEQAPVHHVIDPEALLLFTCSIGRYDQRLFDEVLDWLSVNGRFLNVQRTRNILRHERFDVGQVLSAVADWLSQHESPMKWSLLAKAESPQQKQDSLFFLPDGRPLPDSRDHDPVFRTHGFVRNPVILRNYSQAFAPDAMPCHLLKLRALFGVNTRCDVLVYLTMNRSGHPREIARETYYSQKAIHEVMAELAASGFIHSAKLGRERVFRINPTGLPLLTGGVEVGSWTNWPILLSAANVVWRKVEELSVAALEPRLESSEITLTLRPILQRLTQTSWAPPLPPFANQQGVPLLTVFQDLFQSIAGK